MRPVSLRPLFTAVFFSILFLWVAPAGAQDAARKTPPQPAAKTQKLANPLNDLLNEAQRDIDNKDFAAAIAPLQKFLADEPGIAYAHFQLAYVFTALQRPTEARAEYERAIAIDPQMAEAQLNLGILLLDREPAAAVAPLTAAVRILPAQSRPRFLLGVAQERSGDLPAAAESFEAASRLAPGDAEILVHLGNIYLQTARPVDAEAKFRSVLGIQANNSPALLGLAQSLSAQGKPGAVDAFRDYLVVEPTDDAARRQLARLLIDQEKYDAALAMLDNGGLGVGSTQHTLDVLRLRAEIQMAQKKWDESSATLRQAIALSPRDPELHASLGRVLLRKRDFAGSQTAFRAALQIDPQNLAHWKDLGSAYYLGENYPAALATFDQIAKVEPLSAGAWFIRALCYDKLNQSRLALGAYEKFLELDQSENPDQVWQAQQRIKVLRRILEHKK
jgi:protein O-GlcNAc transferase